MEFRFVHAACNLVLMMTVNAIIMGTVGGKSGRYVREDSTLPVSLLWQMKTAEVTCLA